MSIRPIEPGCLVILISASFRHDEIGKTFRVIERFEPAEQVYGKPSWVLDDEEWAFEEQLLRIDGGENESVTTEQDEEVTA